MSQIPHKMPTPEEMGLSADDIAKLQTRKRYIIVKYASDNFPDGKAPSSMSVYDSYSAKEVGVTQQFYGSEEEAKKDLRKLSNYNLGVSYGIVEAV